MSVVLGRERVFRGISSGSGGVAVGRIRMPDTAARCKSEMLCIFDAPEEEILTGIVRHSAPAGVIVSARAISPWVINLFVCYGIPYIIVKEAFPRELCGRVALLDGEHDRVIIDPNVETLNSLSSYTSYKGPALPIADGSGDMTVLERVGGKGAIIDAPRVHGEELFELLREIAEHRCDGELTVNLRIPTHPNDAESFESDCEAIFRAAVYGRFFLQLEGYSSCRDISEAMTLICHAFCRLESEGREFNGYLPRGVLVDAPVWLMQGSVFPSADFICFDFDAITARMMGIEQRELADTELPREAIMRLWEQYFCSFAPRMPMRATSGVLAQHPIFEEWAERAGIDEIYLP